MSPPLPLHPASRDARWLSLLLAARSSPEIFVAFYDEAAPWLFRLIRRLVGTEIAEDVLADVFLQVWHQLGRFNPEEGRCRRGFP